MVRWKKELADKEAEVAKLEAQKAKLIGEGKDETSDDVQEIGYELYEAQAGLESQQECLSDLRNQLLWHAARDGDFATVEAMLTKGADPGTKGGPEAENLDEFTALHNAVTISDGPIPIEEYVATKLKIVTALLDKGADPNATNGNFMCAGHTPLHHLFISGGHLDMPLDGIVSALLAKGADVKATDGDWLQTPLHEATMHGRGADSAEVKALREAGADWTAKDHLGRTPESYAAENKSGGE